MTTIKSKRAAFREVLERSTREVLAVLQSMPPESIVRVFVGVDDGRDVVLWEPTPDYAANGLPKTKPGHARVRMMGGDLNHFADVRVAADGLSVSL